MPGKMIQLLGSFSYIKIISLIFMYYGVNILLRVIYDRCNHSLSDVSAVSYYVILYIVSLLSFRLLLNVNGMTWFPPVQLG